MTMELKLAMKKIEDNWKNSSYEEILMTHHQWFISVYNSEVIEYSIWHICNPRGVINSNFIFHGDNLDYVRKHNDRVCNTCLVDIPKVILATHKLLSLEI